MVWVEKGSRDGIAMWGELRNWEPKGSHKNDKLDIVTFKLIGLKLHTSGPSQPNMNRSILIKIYSVAIPAFSGTSPRLSVYPESSALLTSLK